MSHSIQIEETGVLRTNRQEPMRKGIYYIHFWNTLHHIIYAVVKLNVKPVTTRNITLSW